MKKILSLVMVFVLALCLVGCGKDGPKADYTFTIEEFVDDCMKKHGSDIGDSMLRAKKIYYNKRIELEGVVVGYDEKDYIEKRATHIGVNMPNYDDRAWEKGEYCFVFFRFKDEADRKKLSKNDHVKLSAIASNFKYYKYNKSDYLEFWFDDAILLEKFGKFKFENAKEKKNN